MNDVLFGNPRFEFSNCEFLQLNLEFGWWGDCLKGCSLPSSLGK